MKNNRTTTASTNVEYVVTASYEWSVPSKITFTDTIAEVEANADTGDTQKVKVLFRTRRSYKSLLARLPLKKRNEIRYQNR